MITLLQLGKEELEGFDCLKIAKSRMRKWTPLGSEEVSVIGWHRDDPHLTKKFLKANFPVSTKRRAVISAAAAAVNQIKMI